MARMKKIDTTRTGVPTITHTFAIDRGPYGMIWKLYLEAEDGDGDMDRIAVVVHQIGYGSYPTDWITIKPQYRSHLTGYLQWNTFSSKAVSLKEWTQITVKVSIFDQVKNESNEMTFPLTFESGVTDQDDFRLPPPFDQRDLPCIGYIRVDLVGEVTGY